MALTVRRDVLATPEWRIEGRDKVTGGALYAADVSRPDALHAAFVGSPHAHARVLSVDAAAAARMPGVRAVITGADVQRTRFGRRLQDWPVLGWDRVRFVGDRVAAVAADSPERAEAAARAITVRYEELPAVFDAEEALSERATLLHPERDSYTVLGAPLGPRPHPNLQARIAHAHGDLAAGFARATRVFEHSFDLPRVVCGYLEPHATVVWLAGPNVHVLTTNKGPFVLREQMAVALGLEQERIVVEMVNVGGDFGGKGMSFDEYPLYFLARATGRPVRSVLRYADDLQLAGSRRAARVRLRTGVDASGRITAHDARIVYDTGAYAAGGAGAYLIPSNFQTLAGYAVPAARIEVLGAYTNTIPGNSVRAPGQTQLMFSADSHLDAIARELGVDPLEFRERNLAREGEISVAGEHWHGSALPEVIAILRREAGWGRPLAAGHGRGVCIGLRHVGRGRASVTLTLDADGTVTALTGLPEQGTGSFTVVQRVIAQELDLDPERVRVRLGTTAEAAEDPGHGGGRATPVHGGAALDGARRLRAELTARAPGLPWDRAARRLAPLTVTGIIDQQEAAHSVYAHAVEVAVDPDTGAVRVLDALLVADVGTIINPLAVMGQMEGGFLFGIGAALMEELVLDEGRIVTANLGDYKLPTLADVPPLRVVLYTGAPGPGPFGAKSIGELAHPGVAPVIANAIADATGVRLTSLPITAEKVLAALRR